MVREVHPEPAGADQFSDRADLVEVAVEYGDVPNLVTDVDVAQIIPDNPHAVRVEVLPGRVPAPGSVRGCFS